MSLKDLPVQRLRLEYTKGEPLRYASHLDMMRLWERALRRASLPVAHSQGFNPRPRIVMAAPLPTGVTSRAELLDVFLTERLDSGDALRRLNDTLPPGAQVTRAWEVPLKGPALMALRGVAEFQARVRWDGAAHALEGRLREWMAQDSVIRERQKKGRTGAYDLRPLVERLWVVGRGEGGFVVGMRLKAEPDGTGRPDEALKSLGLWDDARGVERTALVLPV